MRYPVTIRAEIVPMLQRAYDLTSSQIADVVGIERRSAYQYCRGNPVVSQRNADKIMAALGVTRSELEGQVEECRLRELALHIQQASSIVRSHHRPIKPWMPKEGPVIDPYDSSQWTERTCQRCWHKYRVGSLTTCSDCILAVI